MNKSALNNLCKLSGKHRSYRSNYNLGLTLAFIAGFINAGGFFLVQQYTSHMTGIISIAADEIALGNYISVTLLIAYVVCFVLGSCITTLLVIKARQRCLHSQYSLPLLIETTFLTFIVLIYGMFYTTSFIIPVTIALLCLLMGLQNALITKVSTAIIRTTHVTGMATDLGIEIGRAIFNKGRIDSNKDKIVLHLSIILTFFIGGILGALILIKIGASGLFLPISLLLVISLPPIFKDIFLYRKLKNRNAVMIKSKN